MVEAIAGQSRLKVTFVGRANHAGTTPMDLRYDALGGAAEWVTEVERVARAVPGWWLLWVQWKQTGSN